MSADAHDIRDEFRRSVQAALAGSARSNGSPPVWAPEPVPVSAVRQAAALGWTGLLVDEEYGGAGAGMLEVIIIAEEVGAALSPLPFLSSAVLATTALSIGGSAEHRRQWLPLLASGDRRATVALTGPTGRLDDELIDIVATADGNEVVLDGTAGFVLDAVDADLLIVAARRTDTGRVDLIAVPADAPGLVITEHLAIDRTRHLATVEVRNLRVDGSAALPESAAALAALQQRASVAIAADALGAARRALDLAVEYAKQREQFGRPIGSFQAIKHKLADMYLLGQGARLAVEGAARALDDGADARRLVSVAGSYAIDAATKVTGDAIQVHGGIGYTWEHPGHRLFKRAKFDELYLQNPASHRESLARLVLADQPSCA
jgi:alkylation response protein AidB-like acyl-CoA dehydrogenase